MDNAPAANELPDVARLLTVDLLDIGYNNPSSVMIALRELSRSQARWPSTSMVIDKLKTPPKMHQITKALPRPETTMDARMERSRKTQAFLDRFDPDGSIRREGRKKTRSNRLSRRSKVTAEEEDFLVKAAKEGWKEMQEEQ